MIVVVEGISAAGKTTSCRQYAPHHMIPETGRIERAPDRDLEPFEAARFWSDQSARRWKAALEMERSTGTAVCDTDPLKLHYIWSLWQIGAAPEAHWRQEHAVVRQAFHDHRIGFADLYLVRNVDPALARRQRDKDDTRSRRNFDLHVRLQTALIAWYEALSAVLPQSVVWDWPEQDLSFPAARSNLDSRYSIDSFDATIALLPPPGNSSDQRDQTPGSRK